MVEATRHEVLVILESSAGPMVANEVRQQANVLHSYGNQILVLDASSASVDSIRALPGVARVLLEPPAQPLPELDAGAALFTAAWAARLAQTKPSRRDGEGLSWDAPGHEPP